MMRVYEVTVMVRDDERIEREVWEIGALNEDDARRIARGRLIMLGSGSIVKVKDTLFRTA